MVCYIELLIHVLSFLCRLPKRSQPEKREKWLQLISKHRIFNPQIEFCMICINHFSENQLKQTKQNTSKRILKVNSEPDLLDQINLPDVSNEVTEIVEMVQHVAEEIEHVTEVVDYSEVQKLKLEIERLKLNHDVEIQKYKQRLVAAMLKVDMAKQLKKELEAEQRKNQILTKAMDGFNSIWGNDQSTEVRHNHSEII